MQLFPVAIDYSKGQSLDGTPYKIIRMRVIVDGDGLWSEDDAAGALAASEIAVKNFSEVDGVAVAVIDTVATNLADFAEWTPGTTDLCVRTFLNVAAQSSIFGRDDIWDTIRLGPKTINEWYHSLKLKSLK
jgi:hypothetical protein